MALLDSANGGSRESQGEKQEGGEVGVKRGELNNRKMTKRQGRQGAKGERERDLFFKSAVSDIAGTSLTTI